MASLLAIICSGAAGFIEWLGCVRGRPTKFMVIVIDTTTIFSSNSTAGGGVMNARLAAYVIVIAAVMAAQPIRAIPIHNIVLTEQTGTSLTATYDGVPVTVVFVGPRLSDGWTVTFPSTVSFS